MSTGWHMTYSCHRVCTRSESEYKYMPISKALQQGSSELCTAAVNSFRVLCEDVDLDLGRALPGPILPDPLAAQATPTPSPHRRQHFYVRLFEASIPSRLYLSEACRTSRRSSLPGSFGTSLFCTAVASHIMCQMKHTQEVNSQV